MDLLRGQLRLLAWIFLGLASRPHSRFGCRRGDDLFVAIGSGSASLCDLQIFGRQSAFELHRRPECHLRYRNRLVVARGSGQQPTLGTTAGEQSRPRFLFVSLPSAETQFLDGPRRGKSNPVEN
jgi:hypothetical protein